MCHKSLTKLVISPPTTKFFNTFFIDFSQTFPKMPLFPLYIPLFPKIMRFLLHYKKEIVCTLMLLAGVIASHFGLFDRLIPGRPAAGHLLALFWYLLTVLPVAGVVAADAWREWRRLDFMNEFTLMLLASAGAFLLGEYPEAVAVLLFYSFGEKMEDDASDKVRDRIKSLIGRLPDRAIVVGADGGVQEMNPRDVEPGSVIIVKPGERLPLDGLLISPSEASVDTAAITGESVPRYFKAGGTLLSGMIPLDKEVRLKTIHSFSDSSMSKILSMIEDVASRKSKTETMLRKITRWYTPAVMIAATLLFVVPWIVAAAQGAPFPWRTWLYRSLVFLVCSCPCALVVGVPLSYFAALGKASRLGLLFKGATYIDALRRPDVILFDKTGTLTTGEFRVTSVSPAAGHTEREVVAIAAALDAQSSHPLARAIEGYALSQGIKVDKAEDVKSVVHGIVGTVDGQSAMAGSRSLMSKYAVKVDAVGRESSEICVSLGSDYIGSIYLSDTLKNDAPQAIAALHDLGVPYVGILSGDREEAVAAASKAAGADGFEASLLPADKQRVVEVWREKGKDVVFVGDGINDAPSIATADVGIAMGTRGTDIAMQSADVVIAGDDIGRIPAGIRLARRVREVVITTVAFALGVKLTVMTLGALGIATLWAAVFADTGVTLIVILYTLLALRVGGSEK